MDIIHECFKFGNRWIVKSTCGNKSLQLWHERKPTKRQLEKDYEFLDGKLQLSLQPSSQAVRGVIKELKAQWEK
jgi:hypothetical protein